MKEKKLRVFKWFRENRDISPWAEEVEDIEMQLLILLFLVVVAVVGIGAILFLVGD